jgi:hypothetical protein
VSKTQTYEVSITADAIRTVRVRATSAREAVDKAWGRVSNTGGAWTLCLPGETDIHFSVEDAEGTWVGPTANDNYRDEPFEVDEAAG